MATPGGIILDSDLPENFEASEEEVWEYARWLGMDPETESELLWIAREGIKAPLPQDWKPCKSTSGDIYYFNFATGESRWDHPQDDHYKNLYLEQKQMRKKKVHVEQSTRLSAPPPTDESVMDKIKKEMEDVAKEELEKKKKELDERTAEELEKQRREVEEAHKALVESRKKELQQQLKAEEEQEEKRLRAAMEARVSSIAAELQREEAAQVEALNKTFHATLQELRSNQEASVTEERERQRAVRARAAEEEVAREEEAAAAASERRLGVRAVTLSVGVAVGVAVAAVTAAKIVRAQAQAA